jgi:hypothetical protein
VPDQVAEEMAAELAADLAEAEAEGASAEDVLGSAATDPRSFAAAWAAGRDVIGRPAPSAHRLSLIAATVAVLALVAIVGAVLLINASTPGRDLLVPRSPLSSLVSGPDARIRLVPPAASAERKLVTGSVWVSRDAVAAFVENTSSSSSGHRTIGAVLSIVSLAGIALLAIASLWLARGRRSRSLG